jgi:REP element-mobilizing transposase RayT
MKSLQYKLKKQYRLPKFNYSNGGEYFITICTANHRQYLGEIKNGEMILSSEGNIVHKLWNKIPTQFDNVKIDTYQIMPDHMHGIIILGETRKHLINQMPTFKSGIKNNPMELPGDSLGMIIRWFKGRAKFEISRLNPDFKWQSRYYDRIIRDDKEYYFIEEYIRNNPANWGNGILKEYLKRIQNK